MNGADTGGTITLTYGAGLSASATKPGTGNYWRAELDRQGTPESVQSATVLRNGSFLTSAPYAQRTTSETLGWDASAAERTSVGPGRQFHAVPKFATFESSKHLVVDGEELSHWNHPISFHRKNIFDFADRLCGATRFAQGITGGRKITATSERDMHRLPLIRLIGRRLIARSPGMTKKFSDLLPSTHSDFSGSTTLRFGGVKSINQHNGRRLAMLDCVLRALGITHESFRVTIKRHERVAALLLESVAAFG